MKSKFGLRHLVVALPLVLALAPSARAEVSVSIGVQLPGVRIGVNLPSYPTLAPIPGYPVYYAPQVGVNFFFYDGLYWVFQNDNWYESTWYNGPWTMMAPAKVPLFLLRVPVRYYRAPPPYFRAWVASAAPRWDQHWGRDWAEQRRGWDQWDRRHVPPRAPLPQYQSRYSGDRYPPTPIAQDLIRSHNDRYQPRDPEVRQHVQRDQRDQPRRDERRRDDRPDR